MTSLSLGIRTIVLMAVAVTGTSTSSHAETSEERRARFIASNAAQVAAFQETDIQAPVRPGSVIFTGSSSIRMWDIENSFPGEGYVNRGFGGSTIPGSIRYIDALVIEHKPRLVVFYSGDNDIAVGRPAETVLSDFSYFVGHIHHELPNARIVVISIKPSIARWDKIEEIRRANKLIQEWTTMVDHVDYVDIHDAMLGSDGKPDPDLLLDDGLHLTAAGYAIWNAALAPYLH